MSTPILRPDPPRSNRLPFAALPHALNEDPRLTPRAVRVAAAVLKHALDEATCDPSNRTLAAACRCSIRTVQYALAELRAAGWLRSERGPGGRVIHLAWREAPPCNGPRDPMQRGAAPPCNGLHPKEKSGEGDGRNVTNLPPPEDAASPGPPREPGPGPATAPRPSAPVRPLRDALKALPGADAPEVRSLAWRLAHHLKDLASVGFFLMALGLVARRLTPVERLLAAFVVADRARDTARKPGAIFASAWTGWTPPPLPSEINRPTYFRAPRPPEAPEAPPAPGPMAPEDELAELERLIARGGPVARMARVRLAALGAGVAAAGRPAEAAPDRSH
ncbi:MAG: helix-turn-helix domain-containing protein [Planctomycetaceae bacterium]|nr:helix-turn-helix domain-containing protein [Planctomycetaceae bacterium]MBV8315310.1 helix-turn-helix domain-containing protein [Planctomycetaceae bacterium]MBV8383631.1 helix-turn-helix domain-containing protein [Planctomycetaceae bacterium]MBV8554868.1 helix-turn-helix domain-containing protein [Planctomycetaceae bacterium]